MMIRDRSLKMKVDMLDEHCPQRSCYWARPDPGTFTQGVGYRSRNGLVTWLCGTREIRGCPYPLPDPMEGEE
jgi:hypothetical protein